MSIAFESATISHGMPHGTVYDSPEAGRPMLGMFRTGRGLLEMEKDSVDDRVGEEEDSSSSFSSIGENSDDDDSSGGQQSDGEREEEVQSSFKGPLDALDALEEVLPIKRGVSRFYNGKSRSYTSLEVAACSSSIKDIIKPDNALSRKRKNLLAHTIFFDKNPETTPSTTIEGGLLKKPANNNHMEPTFRTNCSEKGSASSSSPVQSRPPLHPQTMKLPITDSSSIPSAPPSFSPWWSFSLSDLQYAGNRNAAITSSNNGKITVLPPNFG